MSEIIPENCCHVCQHEKFTAITCNAKNCPYPEKRNLSTAEKIKEMPQYGWPNGTATIDRDDAIILIAHEINKSRQQMLKEVLEAIEEKCSDDETWWWYQGKIEEALKERFGDE